MPYDAIERLAEEQRFVSKGFKVEKTPKLFPTQAHDLRDDLMGCPLEFYKTIYGHIVKIKAPKHSVQNISYS